VLAHNVHPTDGELKRLADADAAIAHCPTSNCSLGSGLFPLRRHLAAGVRVALGSDVGAGSGFCLLKEGLQAYFVQQLLGEQGLPLTAAQLLHLATSAGAEALGLAAEVGDLSVGKRFDAVWFRPAPGTTLRRGPANASIPATPSPRPSRWAPRATSPGSGSMERGSNDERTARGGPADRLRPRGAGRARRDPRGGDPRVPGRSRRAHRRSRAAVGPAHGAVLLELGEDEVLLPGSSTRTCM
jgi:hypothetical protein